MVQTNSEKIFRFLINPFWGGSPPGRWTREKGDQQLSELETKLADSVRALQEPPGRSVQGVCHAGHRSISRGGPPKKGLIGLIRDFFHNFI